MKIVLAKAARVPLQGPLRDKGYTADVDQETYDFLLNHGVLESEAKTEPAAAEPVKDKAEAVEEVKEDPKKSGLKKPARSASAAAWRDYASSIGIKTANMSRAELIGAVAKIEK